MPTKSKTKKKEPPTTSDVRKKASGYVRDRLARLELLRDNDPSLTFADRDAIDWAIRMAEQQVQKNADRHEGDTLRNMSLTMAIVESVSSLVGVLGQNYVTNDQIRLYEYLGLKPKQAAK